MHLPKKVGQIAKVNTATFPMLGSYLKAFDPATADMRSERETLSASIFVYSLFTSQRAHEVTVEKRESPDFVMTIDGVETGIEHVSATNEHYMAVLNQLETRPAGTVIEPSFFSPHGGLDRSNRNSSIVEPGDPLSGPGEYGHSTEIKWATFVLAAIQAKTLLLNQTYTRYSKNELLVDDRSPCMFVKLPLAREYFLKQYAQVNQTGQLHSFDRIHVMRDSKIILDILNDDTIHDCSKTNLICGT